MNSLDVELYEYAQQLFEERKLKFKLWGLGNLDSKLPFRIESTVKSTMLTLMKNADTMAFLVQDLRHFIINNDILSNDYQW